MILRLREGMMLGTRAAFFQSVLPSKGQSIGRPAFGITRDVPSEQGLIALNPHHNSNGQPPLCAHLLGHTHTPQAAAAQKRCQQLDVVLTFLGTAILWSCGFPVAALPAREQHAIRRRPNAVAHACMHVHTHTERARAPTLLFSVHPAAVSVLSMSKPHRLPLDQRQNRP